MFSKEADFQEDEYTDFAVNDTTSTIIFITKQDCTAKYIFKRYGDQVVLRRQITKELHILKLRESFRNDHSSYM